MANRGLTPVMFAAAVIFLLATYDILRTVRSSPTALAESLALRVLLVLYPLFLLEGCVNARSQLAGGRAFLRSALCPPLRIVARDVQSGSLIWWPVLGWTPADRRLMRRVTTLTTALLGLCGVPLLAVCARLFALGRPWDDIASSSIVESLLAIMWTVVVAEVCVLAVTVPWTRVWRLHRNSLLLLGVPLAPIVALAFVPRLVRGTLAWYALYPVGVRDPQQRLVRLEEQLVGQVAEVDELRRQLQLEEQARAVGQDHPS